jgi:hypothetical protein
MTKVRDPQRGDLPVMGLEAFIPARSPALSGHSVVDVGYGRLDAGGWYLIRYPDSRYGRKADRAESGNRQVARPSARHALIEE